VGKSAVSYKIYGDREVMARFRALGFKSSDLSSVFGVIAAEVATDARSLAPRRSGRLAGDVRAGKAKTKATIAVGRASVPYAGPVNYGWPRRHIAANLFMNRAADSKAESSAERITREIQHMINETGLG
jgi:hypothetical protein